MSHKILMLNIQYKIEIYNMYYLYIQNINSLTNF